MQRLFLLILFVSLSNINAQYSGYYTVDLNQNVNANVNKNVNVSGNVNVNKNISTIDYGQLALANAQRERNRLESQRISNERERTAAFEIAADPVKAYDYGYRNTFETKGRDAKPFGFKRFTMSYVIPNNSLFVSSGAGRFENVSLDGITTEFTIYAPTYNAEFSELDIEQAGKMENIIEGQLNDDGEKEIYIHKKDLNRATVYGAKGFKSTLIWEDDYQNAITDNYTALDTSKNNEIMYFVKVRTYGDKDEVSFEQLEGRRYYMRRLIEKVISTATVYDMKY